ncbi:hypothetical protein ATANTOWER_029153 [Ataeniobius toweri]|uniref:Uncharacterized protein n=1 Tax=Ataeniobius toweri TaxID=208326 RepID=A0ABU7B9J9_9TELE|nr:hypothetical protein [Ataeniobius toweri]
MGNCVRKQPSLEGDAKFMHSKDPDTVKIMILKDIFRFLLVPIWYRDCNRKTNLGKGKNPVKLKKIKNKFWLAEAHKRKAGNDKKRKEVYIAVAREEDNDTGVVRGRGCSCDGA